MTFAINKKQVAALIPSNSAEWYSLLVELLPKYDINTALRAAAFMSQCSHESSSFTRLRENLNYSAEGLNKTFPKYFIRAGRDAAAYARNPEKIANVVYANRMGNGDVSSGDGWRFIGRGVIQLTGRDNYSTFGRTVDLTAIETISYLETKRGALESACWYWKNNNLNVLADAQDTVAVTKRINGGTTGLEERKALFNAALKILI